MAKKGQKLSAQSIENIRNGQLARWARIKAKVAQGEQHEAHCDADDQHIIDCANPRCAEITAWEKGNQNYGPYGTALLEKMGSKVSLWSRIKAFFKN